MMTSAYANKVLRTLQEDKEFWLNKEREGYVYVAALDEEPVIPDYDYKGYSFICYCLLSCVQCFG